jgi:hypothetical protein
VKLTHNDESGERSTGDFGRVIVVGDSVADGTKKSGDRTSQSEREQEKSEEEACVGLETTHEIDDDVVNDELSEIERQIGQGLGQEQCGGPIHVVSFVL